MTDHWTTDGAAAHPNDAGTSPTTDGDVATPNLAAPGPLIGTDVATSTEAALQAAAPSLPSAPFEAGTSPDPTWSPAGPPPSGAPRARRLAGLLGAGLVLLGAFGAGISVDRSGVLPGSAAPTVAPSGDPNVALIRQAWDLLHKEYVGASSLDDRKLAYGAIDGLTNAVGDVGHTTFLTPEELAASQAELSGTYAGIGAFMDTTGDEPIVVGVFRDSPADRAGLRRGDVVSAVDGKITKGTPLDAVISSVRGPAGTSVTLTIRRDGVSEPLTFHIVRAEVSVPPVDWAFVPGTKIADVRLEQFSTGAADAFRKALGEAMGQGATGVVLDLRENPGGYVNEAIGVASQFLTGGVVYVSRDAKGKETPSPVTSGGIVPNLPLVLLVDGGTASAAEIVTGALQDAGRATVVGVRTFGTGTVLGKFDLADGSALRIGTVEWLTPNGRRIWHQGLTPDVSQALPTDVERVAPADLAGLGTAGVAASPDVQFTKAVALLKAKSPA